MDSNNHIKKDSLKSEKPDSEIIDSGINEVIKQVTNTSEFKNIISDISEKLLELNEQTNTDLETDSRNSDDGSIDEHSLDTTLGAYFMNKDGDNICDCLTKLNVTMEKIAILLNKK